MEILSGIEVYRIPFGAPSRDLISAARYTRSVSASIRALHSLAKDREPDVLHIHGLSNQLMAASAYARSRGKVLVVTTHGEIVADPARLYERSLFYRLVARVGSRFADCLTAPSHWASATAAATVPAFAQSKIVPNGVANTFGDDRVEDDMAAVTFLAYGRHEFQKGFDLLLRAWPILKVAVPQAQLLLGGSGSLTSQLRESSSPGVELVGALDPSDVPRFLKRGHVVVVPSRTEAFGLVALEALAAGKVLVHSGVGGLPDAAGPYGIEVDCSNPHLLARAMAASLTLPKPDAREWIRAHSWTAIESSYSRIYEECLARRGGQVRSRRVNGAHQI